MYLGITADSGNNCHHALLAGKENKVWRDCGIGPEGSVPLHQVVIMRILCVIDKHFIFGNGFSL